MAPEAAGLPVTAAKRSALNNGRSSDSSPQRYHDQVVATSPSTILPFTDASQAGVVVDGRRQAEGLFRPTREVKLWCVPVLAMLIQDAATGQVHQAWERDAQSGTLSRRNLVLTAKLHELPSE